MAAVSRIALVTGANRGLGFETCRLLCQAGHTVILTARDQTKGHEAVQKLSREGLRPRFFALDVTRDDSVRALIKLVQTEFGRLDILINNAAVYLDGRDTAGGHEGQLDILACPPARLQETLDTNLFGPLRMTQAAAPLMKKHNYGRIVNLSSGLGALNEMSNSAPTYSLSKTAVNALTVQQAHSFQGYNVKVNAVCPGWCKTDMGGPGATREAAAGAAGIVWAATLPDDAPTGKFFRDRQVID